VMRQYRKGARKSRRLGIVLLLLLLCVTFLASCIAGSGTFMNLSTFQKDVSAYLNEPMQTELSLSDAVTQKMTEVVQILPMESVNLPSFSSASDAVMLYRDAILNDLLRDNYSLYTGNATTLAQTGDAYPHAVLTTAIPAEDFQNAANRFFGASGVRHKNGDVYSYLDRSDVYTTVLQPWECATELSVDRVEETKNTYRFYFTLANESGEHASYYAVFVKRENAEPCLQMLQSIR